MNLLGQRSDAALVKSARAGDARSVEALVLRYQRKAYAVARAVALDSGVADDIVQEAFLLALKNLPKLRVRASFGPWFLGIVRNVARRTYRHEPRRFYSEPVHTSADELDRLEVAEFRDQVWCEVKKLPPTLREAVLLYYHEGKSVREVAQALGISRSAAKKRLQAGRERLSGGLWGKLEEALRDMLPSAREWRRKGGRIGLIVIASLQSRGIGEGAVIAQEVTSPAVSGAHGAVAALKSVIAGGLMVKRVLIACSVTAILVLASSFLYKGGDREPVEDLKETTSQAPASPTKESAFNDPVGLRRTAWIHGVVLDGYGAPVTDGVAIIRREDPGTAGTDPPEPTDQRVEVTVQGFRAQVSEGASYAVSVNSAAWGTVSLDPLTVQKDLQLEISFRATASIRGFFVGDGDRIKSFEEVPPKVFIEGPLGVPRVTPPRVPVTVPTEGLTFEFHGLGPGSFRIVGSHKGYPFEAVFEIPRNGEEYEVAVEIEKSDEQTFAGRALLARTLDPIPDAALSGYMEVFGATTSLPGSLKTDNDGYFTFTSDKLRRGETVVLYRGHNRPKSTVRFGEVDDEGVHLVVFPDPPPREAVVVNRFREVIPFVEVRLHRIEGTPAEATPYAEKWYHKKAGEDGVLDITDVVPGRFRVTVILTTGLDDLAAPVQIPEDPEVLPISIETELDRILYLTAVKADGSPAHGYAAYARVYQGDVSQPSVVNLNGLPGDLHGVVGNIDGRVMAGVREAERVEIFVMDAVLGFKRLDLDRGWLSSNDHVVARFGEPPEYVDVQVVTQNGQLLDEVTFKIPFVTDTVVEERKADPGAWDRVPTTPFLEVRRRSPGVFRVRLYPGEGSRVELFSPDHGTVTVDTDDLRQHKKVVMPR